MSNHANHQNGQSNDNTTAWSEGDNHFGTLAIHTGYGAKNQTYAPVVPPITLSTTFAQDEPTKHRGFEYARSGNPSRQILEETLAALDKGKYGMCFSSGLAATTNVVALLSSGEHIITIDDVYGGTGRLFRAMSKSAGLHTDFLDFSSNITKLTAALKPNTKLVWIESPTNPTLQVIDIAKVSKAVHDYSKDIIVVVDNTFLTPFYQRPLELGADLVAYSLTKYMNGHSDVVMGAIVTSNEDLFQRISFFQNSLGAVPSPFDCFLVARSLKTLHVRMPRHMENGLAVGKFLEKHPKVTKVIHPGLPSHPQHALTLKQASGHSGLLSFYLKEGSSPVEFLKNLKIFTLAESLGGYESLAEVPSSMTHASVPAELREKLGITDNLIRLSVGLESEADLIEDLNQALKAC